MITERPNTYDFRLNIENARPLWMHRIRFRLQDRRYARKMQAVFAMGGQAVDYFKSVNKHWSVFPFCYCTQSNTIEAKDIEGATRFAFVGSIEPRKNPMGLLMAANELKKDEKFTLSIIGNGSLYAKASAFIGQNGLDDMVKMLGTQPQERIPELLSEADVLVLPSLYDGWGAVVNEALQAGCYVIVSDACGASSLLDGREGLGSVFNHHDTAALASQMALCCDRIGEIRSHRSYRRQWTEAHIGGSAVARYMVDCLSRIRG